MSSLLVCHVLLVYALNLIILFGGQSVLWDQGVIACSLFLTPLFSHTHKIAVMHCLEPKSYNKPFELLHFLGFWL